MRFAGYRVLHSVPAALAAALLLWPAAPIKSATPATQRLNLEGPFPIRQWVNVWIPSVHVGPWGGDYWSPGDYRFRFRLDVRHCDQFEPDKVHVFPARVSPLQSDCDYAHAVRRDFHFTGADNARDVEVRLPPPPTAHDPTPLLPISRYGGNQVRVRIGGTEDDLFQDEPMGGAVAVFGPRGLEYPNFGGGGDPMATGGREHAFDTCGESGGHTGDDPYQGSNPEEIFTGGYACYSTTFHVLVGPQVTEQDRNLRVYEVGGPDNCIGGEPVTWGISVMNPEPVTSESYAATIGLLDPDTNAMVRQWNSTAQPGVGPFGAAAAIAVPNVTLPPGEHRLVISAGMHMATAVEVTIGCKLSPRGIDSLPVRLPTPAPAPRPGIDVVNPR